MQISLAQTSGEADAAIDLAERVWGSRPLSEPMLRALELAGMYVSVARDADDLVGMCAGFVGIHDDGSGSHLHLHSHLAAVDPSRRGQGIGRALKRHQREWCLEHGIDTVSWTFDPLVRENARFNLHHLGAVGDRYLVDLYGAMDDEINKGDPSDRLLVRWDLRGRSALAALDRPLPLARRDELRRAGAVEAVVEVDGAPEPHDAEGEVRLVAAPAGIVELRDRDPQLASRWRHAVRDAMLAAFRAGLRPVAMTDDHAYVLRPSDPPEHR